MGALGGFLIADGAAKYRLDRNLASLVLTPFQHNARLALLALMLLALSGCAQMPNAEPPLIARKPKPTPLPAAVLQIDLKPSTASLSRGLQWSENSERILSDAIRR